MFLSDGADRVKWQWIAHEQASSCIAQHRSRPRGLGSVAFLVMMLAIGNIAPHAAMFPAPVQRARPGSARS
jgi:hypothetical protein